MSKEKYYTPTIEEFHVGFEFEYIDTDGSWDKYIANCIKSYKEAIELIEQGKVRVKFLDKESLINHGFIVEQKPQGSFNEYEYSIKNKNGTTLADFYEGFIKNKSELKRLLTQLGIKV